MAAVTTNQHFDGWDSESIMVVTVATVSVYNAFELLFMIAAKFRERRSLLFISLVVSSLGILPYFSGFLCEYFQSMVFWASMMISSIGWIALITGQSVVLYSRLGLILNNERILKAVKWMIIVNAIVWHTSTTVIQYGKTYGSQRHNFSIAMHYIEKIQMTAFCIQEFIISGLYLWKTIDLLRVIQKNRIKKIMAELLTVNVIIIVGDIGLLVLEYSGMRVEERLFKGFVYSVKLKLELAILTKLVDLVQTSQRTLSNALADVNTFVDVSRTNTNATAQTAHGVKDDMPDWLAKLEERDVQHLETVDRTGSAAFMNSDPFITRKEV